MILLSFPGVGLVFTAPGNRGNEKLHGWG